MNIKANFSELKSEMSASLNNVNSLKAKASNVVYINGATYYPSISDDGTLSWINDKGLENPAPVNIKGEKGEQGIQGIQGEKGDKGDKGEKGNTGANGTNGINGKDGYTPVKGVDYFDGKDGKNGTNGVNGKDGYTPVKGVDYFTEDDKAELVQSVISALPKYDGEVVIDE